MREKALGRGLFFERADVAGAVVEELDEFGQRGGIAGLAEGGLAGGVELFVCGSGSDAVETARGSSRGSCQMRIA